MRAHWWQKVWIALRVVMMTLRYAIWLLLCLIFAPRSAWLKCANRIMHRWGYRLAQFARIKCKIIYHDSFVFQPGETYILMSNHSSHMDIPILFTTFADEQIAMLAKKELFRIPLMGWGMRIGGCVAIDRENKREALRDLQNAQEVMARGIRLWVSPEGKRSLDGRLNPFKRGGFKLALATQAKIVPITIIGSNHILPAKTLDLHLGCPIEVHIGTPIDTRLYSPTQLKELMDEVAMQITKWLPQ